MIGKIKIRVLVDLKGSMYLCGQQAPESKALIDELSATLPDTRIPIDIPALTVLCAAADEMRRQGKAEAVKAVGAIIKELKKGAQRRILGVFHHKARTVGEIDDALEAIRKQAIQRAGG